MVDRNGNRYSKQGTGKQGGRRIKSEMKAPGWLYPGVHEAMLELSYENISECNDSSDSDNASIDSRSED